MAKTGGAAAKLGNQYEDLWIWREILRLLEGEIDIRAVQKEIKSLEAELSKTQRELRLG